MIAKIFILVVTQLLFSVIVLKFYPSLFPASNSHTIDQYKQLYLQAPGQLQRISQFQFIEVDSRETLPSSNQMQTGQITSHQYLTREAYFTNYLNYQL